MNNKMLKKAVSALLAVVAVSSVAISASAYDINKYDLNSDGILDVRDVTYLQNAIANGDNIDSKADFDKSGTINVNDVTYAQNIINGSFYVKPDFKLQSNSKSKLNFKSVYSGADSKYPKTMPTTQRLWILAKNGTDTAIGCHTHRIRTETISTKIRQLSVQTTL